MKFSLKERDRRWTAARRLMEMRGVDVLIAWGNLGDVPSDQRYLSNYRSVFEDAVVLVFRERDVELVVSFVATRSLAKQLSWIEEPVAASAAKAWLVGEGVSKEVAGAPSVGGEIANQLGRRGITRVGVVGLEMFPSGWKETISNAVPGASFVDMKSDVEHLRLLKSSEEHALIRESCRIADEAWMQIPEIVRVGRRRYEVLADIEHILKRNGCEDSYNLFMPLPMLAKPIDQFMYSEEKIEHGEVFNVEVSPRFHGYFGQRTSLVSMGPTPKTMRDAFNATVSAREAGLAIMKPGVDLVDVTSTIAKQMRVMGYELASPLIGHFVGLDLEEPRAGASSFILEAGMTFICHPFAVGFPAVMRADTFLITDTGAERLTSGAMEPLEL